jgi:hypothetical protein
MCITSETCRANSVIKTALNNLHQAGPNKTRVVTCSVFVFTWVLDIVHIARTKQKTNTGSDWAVRVVQICEWQILEQN